MPRLRRASTAGFRSSPSIPRRRNSSATSRTRDANGNWRECLRSSTFTTFPVTPSARRYLCLPKRPSAPPEPLASAARAPEPRTEPRTGGRPRSWSRPCGHRFVLRPTLVCPLCCAPSPRRPRRVLPSRRPRSGEPRPPPAARHPRPAAAPTAALRPRPRLLGRPRQALARLARHARIVQPATVLRWHRLGFLELIPLWWTLNERQIR